MALFFPHLIKNHMKGGKVMKRYALILVSIFLGIMILSFHYGVAAPHQGQTNQPPQQIGPQDEGDWFCPWCGRRHMGSGMTGPGMMPDYGMGPGMMGHRGYGTGQGMTGPRYDKKTGPIGKDQAKMLAERYVQSTGNPNLKLGKVEEKETYYEAEIVTKDNSLVDKLQIDKNTGWLRFAR
jgi:hypothetical protein